LSSFSSALKAPAHASLARDRRDDCNVTDSEDVPDAGPQELDNSQLDADLLLPAAEQYGLFTVVSQPSEKAGVIDIIAIHGINGHYNKT
jgi:hypothetical protein